MKVPGFLVLLLLLVLPAPSVAQLPTGAIRGVVTDQSGGVLPGTTVTVTERRTGLTRTTTTNDIGLYRFAGLPSGMYNVVAELPAVGKAIGTVELILNQEAELNLTVALAGVAEEITVAATSPVIETARSEVSRSFRAEQIENMPLPGRNYLNLAFFVPGVTTGGTGGGQGFGGAVNGQRSRNVNFIIDGSDNNDASVTGTRSPITQDAVGEFRLVTSVFPAEYGRNSGAVAIATTRSGTNAFRGTAFEYFEDAEVLNARDNLEKAAGFDKPGKLRRDTYGFTLGGPIQRDRLFFFGALQKRPFEGRGAAVPIPSPTQQGRALLATVPGASPVMLELLNTHIPLPNAGRPRTFAVGGIQIPFEDYIATLPNSSDDDQYIGRIDFNPSATNSFFGRHIYRKFESVGASNPPGFANDSVFPTHNFVGTWNRVLTSALFNEFHFSYGRTGGLFPGGSTNPGGNNTMPTLGVQGFWTLGLAVNIPQDRKEQVWQFTDSMSYLRGKHAIKFGADVRKVQLTSLVPFDFRGTYTFQNFTQFITNSPFSVLQAYGDPEPAFNFVEQAYFVQDDWKATPHLTLNLGLRYERVGADQGYFSNVSSDNNNFGPRVGFAWDLSKTGRLVLRGGYAITYDQFYLNIPLLAGQGPPFQRRITDFTGLSYPNVPADRALSPAELLTLNLIDIPDDARSPYAQQWQMGIQRQFRERWRVEAAYVGSRGLKQLRQRVANPLVCCPRVIITSPTGAAAFQRHGDPQRTGQDTILETSASSAYHSGQISVDRRFSDGFSVNASYTLSKYIDDASEPLATGTPSLQRPQDNFNLRAERGLSSFDRPHRFTVGWLWEVPAWRGQQGVVGRVLGGWNFGGGYTYQSGQPFTVITGVDSNGDGDPANDRPNLIPGGDRRSVSGYELRPALSGGNGNLGRNTERGPVTNNWNAVLFKNVRLYNNHQLQFRGEFFNLLNHRQFTLLTSARDRNLSVPDQFYNFTSSNGGNRSIVLGVKYLF